MTDPAPEIPFPFETDNVIGDVGHTRLHNKVGFEVNQMITSDEAYDNFVTKEQMEAAIAAAVGAGPQVPDAAPVSPYKPDDVLNIGAAAGKNHFYVQVARNGDSTYLSKTQAEIQAGYEEAPYFYTVTDGSGIERVHMQARMDAPTTSGTTYSRCELRELDQAGANIAFDASTSTHRMLGKTRITHLPPVKPEVVIAQLHDGNRDRIAIRTQAGPSGGPNQLSIRVAGTVANPGWQEGIAYTINREIAWKIEGINGTWRVYITDMSSPKVTATFADLESTSTSWYFKTGCYNQSNETIDSATEYGAVELRDLQHWHTGWTTNQALPVLT